MRLDMVADQGGEFQIVVAGPVADFIHFGGGEEAEIGVAAYEVRLFADGEVVGANGEALFEFAGPHVGDCALLAVFVEVGEGGVGDEGFGDVGDLDHAFAGYLAGFVESFRAQLDRIGGFFAGVALTVLFHISEYIRNIGRDVLVGKEGAEEVLGVEGAKVVV